jgi:hypothetical protein
MPVPNSIRSKLPTVVVALLILTAIIRVVLVDRTMPQGFDEPCHVAAGIKWLDRGDYTLDSVHPPLARYAVALPLYVSGERFPKFRAQDTIINGYCTELGNAILSDGGHYWRNLFLARVGILPFLALAGVLVFLWTRQEFGNFAGCMAAFLFLTLPTVLAFSGLAYTDLPAMCMQFACLVAFAAWLKKPTTSSTLLLGISAGLALSAKLTSFLYLPLACAAMMIVKLWSARGHQSEGLKTRDAAQLVAGMCIVLTILWGSYAFSIGHIDDAIGLSPTTQAYTPRPGVARSAFQKFVLADPLIPAPDLIRGVVIARQMNKHAPESYLLGSEKPGGWWYFFPVAVALKTPLPFLILAIIGLVHTIRLARHGQWSALASTVAVAAIFIATMFVSLRVGTRHVLVVWPLLSLLAGCGASLLWRMPGTRRVWGRLALCLLLAWQTTASMRAQGDLLAYFNELAPADPSEALVKGCDLDCGQDVFRLSRELRARGVTHVGLGIWSSADLALLDLPQRQILQPHTPVSGWVAVSLRALKTGQVVFCEDGHILPDKDYPHDTLSWLEQYRPVAHVGKTILLYDIPKTAIETAKRPGP